MQPPLAPGAPRAVGATVQYPAAGGRRILVTWRAPSGGGPFDRYVVDRDGHETRRVGTGTTQWPDPGYDGASHTYVVHADGPGGRGTSAPFVLDRGPSAPTGLTARYGPRGEGLLTWSQPRTGGPVTSYQIRRDGQRIADLDAPRTSYPDRTYDGRRHVYQVRVLGPGGDAYSAPIVLALAAAAAPQRVSATVGPYCGFDVTWTEPTGGGPRSAYALLRDGAQIARMGPGVTRYVDHNADSSPEYRVRSIGPGGTRTSGPATMPGLGLCASIDPSRLLGTAQPRANTTADLGVVARVTGPIDLVLDLDDRPSVPGVPALPAVPPPPPPPPVLPILPALPAVPGLPAPPALGQRRRGRRPESPPVRLS
ncbi:MAG TPA: hypothetical protein VGP02_02325 [Mycobacteriales bacterium]|nr:hypothetical protein [Mycobacteriales bacterium]